MRAENDNENLPPSVSSPDALSQECLTDMIDQLGRKAFRRALERRHGAVPYREIVESALVRTSSS